MFRLGSLVTTRVSTMNLRVFCIIGMSPTSGENLLNARTPIEHTREPHSQPRTPIRRIWLITLSNTNPIELQGIVEQKTLHTLATYRRLCIYHTLLNNIGISLFSAKVIIQGDVSVFHVYSGRKLRAVVTS